MLSQSVRSVIRRCELEMVRETGKVWVGASVGQGHEWSFGELVTEQVVRVRVKVGLQ